jgi:hypothetical protein
MRDGRLITQDVADLEAVPLGPVVVRLGTVARRHRPPLLVTDAEHHRRQRRHRRGRKEGAGHREHGAAEAGDRH